MQQSWANRLVHFLRGPNPLHPRIWSRRLKPVTFRRFQPSDLPDCLELHELNRPERFPELPPNHYRDYLLGGAYFLTAEDEGRVIASGGISYHSRTVAALCFGLIHPDYQGDGLGAALVLARLALLKPSEPYYRVMICAVAKSIGYYHRFGFRTFNTWKDKNGERHPAGLLYLTSGEILKCRELLAAHSISFPLDEDSVPYYAGLAD